MARTGFVLGIIGAGVVLALNALWTAVIAHIMHASY